MRKTLITTVALLIAAASVVSAQSPPASATATISGKTLSVQYSAPSVRGRKIFGAGGLLSRDPTYPVWRAGANSATVFHTDADLDVGGLNVPKGTYTLYVSVQDPEAWQLIVNKQTGQWGLSYSAAQDLGRVKMTMAKPPARVEKLNYSLVDLGAGKGELRLAWENHIGRVPIAVK
jgi:Protein of unknown function (DUF2911)